MQFVISIVLEVIKIKNKKGSIYIIRNKINNKVYIGQTTQEVEERFKQHIKLLKTNKNQLISRAIKKYGKENFYYEVLESNIDITELDNKEEFYIAKYSAFGSGYNLCAGGKQSRRQKKEYPEQEIINLYCNNISIREIARIYNTNHCTISQILKNNNIFIKSRNKTSINLTLEDKKYISLLYLKGYSISIIKDLTGFSERTIYRYRNEIA